MNSKDLVVWMIVIRDNPISILHMEKSLPSWKNYKIEIFNAVTPKDLSFLNELFFYKKWSSGNSFTDTEKAVWYSHFLLWKQCFYEKKPLIVIEHDSILRKDIGSVTHSKLLSFLTDRKETPMDPVEDGKILSPGSGYVIFPDEILPFINFIKNVPIISNVDGYIRDFIQTKYGWPSDFSYIEQKQQSCYTTIDHGKNFLDVW